MNIRDQFNKLFKKLSSDDFQDPNTGIFQSYMFVYDAELEYEFRKEIETIQDRLKRPNVFIDVKVINLFDELVAYLESETFGFQNWLQYSLETEREDHEHINKSLKLKAREEGFYNQVFLRVKDFISEIHELKRPYVFFTGIGQLFPYLRASIFLNQYEKYLTGDHKIIIFYPGKAETNYSLFNKLIDENPYHSIRLIN